MRHDLPMARTTHDNASGERSDIHDKMAVNNFVIDEMLCFLLHKHGYFTANYLKQVTLDFFKPEDVSRSKETILENIGRL